MVEQSGEMLLMLSPRASPNRSPDEARSANSTRYFCSSVFSTMAVTTSPVNDGRRCFCGLTTGISIYSWSHSTLKTRWCVGSHSTRWVVPLLCAFLRSALSRGALPPAPPGVYFPPPMQGAVGEVLGDTLPSPPQGGGHTVPGTRAPHSSPPHLPFP